MIQLKSIFICALLSFSLSSFAQSFSPYKIYTSDGKPATFEDVIKAASKTDLVFFGELHNDPIAHWLEFKLVEALAQKSKVKVGMEMFETDDQVKLNEFGNGYITEKQFEAEAKLWSNYKQDYKPIVSFCVKNKIPVYGTNVPRRYASMMNKQGMDFINNVDAAAKNWMPPFPLQVDTNLSSYQEMMQMGMHAAMGVNMVYAQALKDATMAWNIMQELEKNSIYIHFNGEFHSQKKEGICAFLPQYGKKKVELLTISCQERPVDTFDSEDAGRADFIIYLNDDMIKSY